jgi:arylsulfotransferase ASST
VRVTSPEEEARMKRLLALGYVSGSAPAPAAEGVVRWDREKAWDGLNLVVSGHAPEASLVDMDGTVLHTWHRTYEDVWPGRPLVGPNGKFWRRAHLFPNGDLLAIFDGYGLVKLDRDSKILWHYDGRAHHDLFVTDGGEIYVLTREDNLLPEVNPSEPVTEDFIVVLGPDGVERRKVSVYQAVKRSAFASILKDMPSKGDLFHTNTIELVDARARKKLPTVEPGTVLVSIHRLATVGIVDLDTGVLVWMLRGSWLFQHQPTFLDDGNLLIFDNLGTPDRSSVLEVDPWTGQVVWKYQADRPNEFFSFSCGAAARLPNGNTLVSESDSGRAFELTPEKEIVWEYLNPQRAGPNRELIATLFEVVRLPRDVASGWLPAR